MNIKARYVSLKNNKLAYIGLLLAVIVLLLTFNSLSNSYKAFSIGIDDTGFPYKIVHDNGDVEYFSTIEEYAAAKDADTKNEVDNMHKGILASPLDNLRGFIRGLFQKLGGFIVDGMVDNFDPTFSAWYKLEHGISVATDKLTGLEKSSPQEIITMTETEFEAYMPSAAMIFRAAKVVGIALSSILVIINLFLCLFGQANAIRTTVVKTMGMWAVSLISIFLSYKLVVASMKIMYAVWDVITSYGAQNINWYYFSACEGMVTPKTILGGVGVVATFFFGWFVLLFTIIMLIKPLKGFFKLYCQLIEYYVAYIVILLMFPAVVATIVSPSTINIFKAYCRMVIMEMLLLTFSGVFMKVFAILLINGTLFASIPNYIACLCVIKVAQNLQQYASAIGINSVQATGSFMQACGSGFMGLLTSFNMLSRSGANLGNMMKNTGVALNREGMFKMGSALQNPMQATLQTMGKGHAGTYQDTLHNNFTNALKQRGSGMSPSGMNQYGSVESALKGTMPESCTGAMRSVYGYDFDKRITDIKHYADGSVVATGKVGYDAKNIQSVWINPDGSWEVGKGSQEISKDALLSEATGIGSQTAWHKGKSYGSIPKEGGGLECPELIEGIRYGEGVSCSMTDSEVRDHIISEDEFLVKTYDEMTGNNYYTAAYPETMNTPEIAAHAKEMGFVDMGMTSENGFFTHNYMKVEHNSRQSGDDSERDDGSDANRANRRTRSRERSTAQKTGGNKA